MTYTRIRVVVALAVITLFINAGIARMLPPLMPIPSITLTLGLFGALIIAFDTWLWRIPFLYTIGFVEHPYIGGEWVGNLTTSYDDQSRITDVAVHIHQNWTVLRVNFFSTAANSTSLSASFFRQPSGRHTLTYIYDSQPTAKASPTVVPHLGMTVLHLTDDRMLIGYYHYVYQDDSEEAVIRGQLVLKRPRDAFAPEAVP
jgi:hypothetical protein